MLFYDDTSEVRYKFVSPFDKNFASCLGYRQATANDALSTEITKIEALAAAAMPQLDAALVKSICVGTQTISKGKDDASAANVIQVVPHAL